MQFAAFQTPGLTPGQFWVEVVALQFKVPQDGLMVQRTVAVSSRMPPSKALFMIRLICLLLERFQEGMEAVLQVDQLPVGGKKLPLMMGEPLSSTVTSGLRVPPLA